MGSQSFCKYSLDSIDRVIRSISRENSPIPFLTREKCLNDKDLPKSTVRKSDSIKSVGPRRSEYKNKLSAVNNYYNYYNIDKIERDEKIKQVKTRLSSNIPTLKSPETRKSNLRPSLSLSIPGNLAEISNHAICSARQSLNDLTKNMIEICCSSYVSRDTKTSGEENNAVSIRQLALSSAEINIDGTGGWVDDVTVL